eukprot:scaffold3603_cov69-Cylindrotheca_fusiformis.AAC.2
MAWGTGAAGGTCDAERIGFSKISRRRQQKASKTVADILKPSRGFAEAFSSGATFGLLSMTSAVEEIDVSISKSNLTLTTP